MNPLVQTSNLSIHQKIMTEICMQLVLSYDNSPSNNKVLVHNGSLCFFKIYWQPIIKFWLVPVVPVHEKVHIFKYLANLVSNLCKKCDLTFHRSFRSVILQAMVTFIKAFLNNEELELIIIPVHHQIMHKN